MPETMTERIKAALKGAGLSVKGLAEAWAVDRSGLSDRIHGARLSEEEVQRIAEITHTTPAYLRYGVRGDHADGMMQAAHIMSQTLTAIIGEAMRGRSLPGAGVITEADVVAIVADRARRELAGLAPADTTTAPSAQGEGAVKRAKAR